MGQYMSNSAEFKVKNGDIGKVTGYVANCPAVYRSQLLAMGAVPGSSFTFLRQAPLGDPIVIRINNTDLTLRKAELAYLQIKWMANER
jgi:ferrous iron transport protein A